MQFYALWLRRCALYAAGRTRARPLYFENRNGQSSRVNDTPSSCGLTVRVKRWQLKYASSDRSKVSFRHVFLILGCMVPEVE